MGFLIQGLGLATPPFAASQSDTAAIALELCAAPPREGKLVAGVYARTGIRARRSVLLDAPTNGVPARQSFFEPARAGAEFGPGTSNRMDRYRHDAPPLAASAAQHALHESQTDAAEITDLVTVSCSGFTAPGLDACLIDELGLARDVSRTHVGFMGCHGAINGLRVASALAQARPGGRVLLCAVELCSLHHQYGHDRNNVVANALFADGAAALVGTYFSPPLDEPAKHAQPTAVAFGSCVLPDSRDMMTWNIGDHGFEMFLSPRVPDLIAEHLQPWLTSWLSGLQLSMDKIGSWAIHPGGPKVLNACQAALGLNDADLASSREVLRDYGNMSSPTVLFILERLQQERAVLPCVMLAFGPGLVIEAALFA